MSSTLLALLVFAMSLVTIFGVMLAHSSLFTNRPVTERSIKHLLGLNWLKTGKSNVILGKGAHTGGVIAATMLAFGFGVSSWPVLVITFAVFINVMLNTFMGARAEKILDEWWKEQLRVTPEDYLSLPAMSMEAKPETFQDKWHLACMRVGIADVLDSSGKKGTPPLVRILPDGIVIDPIGYDEDAFERLSGKLALTIRKHIHRAETLPDGNMKLHFQGRELPKMLTLADMKLNGKIIFGESVNGFVEFLPEEGPHGLIAGTSGSGKSTGLVWLAYQFIKLYPDAIVFYAGVKAKDFEVFDLFKAWPNFVDARNVEQFTAAVMELERERAAREEGRSSMNSKSFAIIDEYNALINEGNLKIIESLVTLSRSANYHMWLASQRPTVSDSAISGIVRENLGMRWCFKVIARRDSMIMLDNPAAYKIKRNPGRAVILDRNTGKMLEAQCPMITKADVINLVQSEKCIVNPFAQVLRDVIKEAEKNRKEQIQ